MNPPTQLLLSASAFLLTPVFGFWLSKKGKPYNGLLFNLHKLLALATVVLGAARIYGIRNAPHVETVAILAMVVAGVGLMVLFLTGALMSANKSNQALVLALHRIATVVLVIALAGTLYLVESA